MKRRGRLIAALCLGIAVSAANDIPAIGASPGSGVKYQAFSSALYRYTVMQPESFRHIILPDALGRQVDYFYPGLGSNVTDVNIFAARHDRLQNEAYVMRSRGATRVHVSGYLLLDHMRIAIVSGDWNGIPGRWREEGAQFADRGLIWHLTLSYLLKYSSMRSMMVHMLQTFRPY